MASARGGRSRVSSLSSVTGTGRSSGEIWTWSVLTLSTSGVPLASSTSPRGAAMSIWRTRLTVAALTYWSPESTWRNHRRKKMMANSPSAKLPTMATRRASCGVSGGRRSSGGAVIGRPGWSVDLAQPLGGALERAEAAGGVGAAPAPAGIVGERRVDDAAHRRVHRQRDQRVDEDRDQQLLQEQEAHRSVDAEQELDERHADARHRRRRRARRQRHQPVRGVAQLAQAPRPVADGDVQQ